MERKLSIRFTAFLLAFCMIMSLIPAMPNVTAQAAETTETVELKFAELDYNGSAYWYKNLADITANEGNWVLNRDKTDTNMLTQITTGQADNFQFQGIWGEASKGMKANIKADYGKMVFDFEVKSAGTYDLTAALKSLGANNTGILSISVEDGNGIETELATINGSGTTPLDSWVSVESPDFKEVVLTKGTNYLILKGIENATYGNYWLIQGFTFAQTAVEEIEQEIELKVNLDVTTAVVGDKVNVNAYAILSDGSPYYPSDFTGDDKIEISVFDDDIAAVDNGVLTALAAGSTDVTVTAKVKGKELSSTVKLNVIALPQGDFKLIADTTFPIRVGRTAKILVQGVFANLIVNMDKAKNISVEGYDANIAEVTVINKNKNLQVQVVGVAEGDTSITLKAEYNGVPAQVVIPIEIRKETVARGPHVVNFIAYPYDSLNIDVHGLGVNRDLTNSEILARENTIVYTGHSMKADMKKGEALYLDFMLPSSGEFSVDFGGHYVGQYGFVAEFYVDDKYIGEYNFSDATGLQTDDGVNSTEHFRNISLEAGKHTLKIERVSDNGHYMWMRELKFTPVVEKPVIAGINSSCDMDTISLNDTSKAKFTVRMSDGTDYFIPATVENNGKIVVKNKTQERVLYSNGLLSPRKAGLAIFNIDASLPIENGDISACWTINVADGQLFDFRAAKETNPDDIMLGDTDWAVSGETTVDKSSDYNIGTAGFTAKFAKSDELVLDVNVKEDGIYNIDVVGVQKKTGCKAAFWFENTYLGCFDFANESEKSEVARQLNTIELSEGIHKLYIKSMDDGKDICLNRMVIIPVDSAPVFSHANIIVPSTEIALGKTLQAEFKIWMNDGREYHIGKNRKGSVDEKNKVEYSTSSESVFSVNADGLMTGNTVGKANLIVNATVNGNPIDPEIKEMSVVNVLSLRTDGVFKLERGSTMSAELTATMDDIPVDISKATEFNVFSFDGHSKGEVKIENGKAMLYLTAVRGGHTYATVEAVYNGIVGSVDVPMSVDIPMNEESAMSLEFRSGMGDVPSDPDSATIAQYDWQVNKEISSPAAYTNSEYSIQADGIKTQLNLNENFTIDFHAKRAGNYAINFVGAQCGAYGVKAAIYVNGKYAGEFDFSHPTKTSETAVNANVSAALNTLPLNAGTNTITIKCIDRGGKYIWWSAVDFKIVESNITFSHVQAEVEKNVLGVGESTEIKTAAIMSDGSAYHIGANFDGSIDGNDSFTVSNSNPEVAEIREGRLYALSAGETTIMVTGVINGKEIVAFIDITVDDSPITSVEAGLKKPLYEGSNAELDIQVFAGDRQMDLDNVSISIKPDKESIVSVYQGDPVELKFAEIDGKSGLMLKDITVNEGNWVLYKNKTDANMLSQITTGQANNFMFQGVYGEEMKGMKANINANFGKMVFGFEVEAAGIYDLTSALKSLGANNTGVLSIAVEDGDGNITNLGTIDGSKTTPIDSWVSVASPKFNEVALTKGINYLILEGAANSNSQWPGNYWLIQGFSFTPKKIPNSNKLFGVKAGNTKVTVSATYAGVTVSNDIDVTVIEGEEKKLVVSADATRIRPNSDGTQIRVELLSADGESVDMNEVDIEYEVDVDGIINVSSSGAVTPVTFGEATVTVRVMVDGFEYSDTIKIVVTGGKVSRSYYTDERVSNALNNISKFSWARSEKDKIVAQADARLADNDVLWNLLTTQELPRSIYVGYRWDPNLSWCRYCGYDLSRHPNGVVYAWKIDPINSPWKIQCPECRNKFPTNDFGSFYKLGIVKGIEEGVYNVPAGQWSYEKAHYEHYKQFAADYETAGVESYEEHKRIRESGKRLPPVGYLKNESNMDLSVETLNNGRGLSGDEIPEGWGVDDGYGYKTGVVHDTSNGKVEEAHTYVAYYNDILYIQHMSYAPYVLGLAYLYTGDKKYGRAGAIILDRIADVYPEMDHSVYFPTFPASDSSTHFGKIDGCIWESSINGNWAFAYDALYPIFDDPQVIAFLSQKAESYNASNKKATGEDIRRNIEDNILREIFEATKAGDSYGNFGLHQTPLVKTAVVLDTMPETQEMLDYVMQKDESGWHQGDHTGGDFMNTIINKVDRDGGTGEGVAPNYAVLWTSSIAKIADALNGYEGYPQADIFKHLKFQKMMENVVDLVQARRTSINSGDSGSTAGVGFNYPSMSLMIQAFRATNNVKLAQAIYFFNGNSVKGLHGDVFAEDPDILQKDIEKIIDEYGEYPFDNSLMHAGEGYAILRDGSWYGRDTISEHDNQRDFWMMFSRYGTHSHPDALNLGIHAYGLDFAPDLGYPTFSDGSDQQVNWEIATINHNTVIVNDKDQVYYKKSGTPLHFDDAGRVKVMDARHPEAYAETDEYRRTVVMVEANDDVSYGVDFFRVKGGSEHLYSFHALSDTISEYGGFTTEEKDGTYAGEGVAYKTTGIENGYSYLNNVRVDEEPNTGEFFVDFEVTDFKKTIEDSKDLHMRLTMLNDFNLSEITFAKGEAPKTDKNPESLEFVLARRSSEDGSALDTTFTAVLEPYKGDRYIVGTEQVDIKRVDGKDINSNGDVARAVKVQLVGGRCDYVIYATNNRVEYVVDNKIRFKGFVGVCTYVNDELNYSYLSDGTDLKDTELNVGINTISEYSGEIVDFTRGIEFENKITVKFYDGVSLKELQENAVGRWMHVENDGVENAVYEIKGITVGEKEGTVDISLGNITLIRSAENATTSGGDYVYNIAPRQWFNVPLSSTMSLAPVFNSDNYDTGLTAGKKFTQSLAATSPRSRKITYSGDMLPRGASIDAETGLLSWTPDNNQVGEHHVQITADDGIMKTTIHFTLTVYKSAGDGTASDNSGNNSDTNSGNSTNNNQGTQSGTGTTPPAGGGGGGGGSSSDGDTSDDAGNTETGDDSGNVGDDRLDVQTEKFVDLGNHTWAKDAIYSLVDAGVVNGTSENTYSPENNIKRADFAIMLVRAFGITGGEGENFADVDADKYYAKELLLAKANGIVAGIGDNKFNPEGEITRQDMMLMLTRALEAQGKKLDEANESALAQFADAAQISDYAKSAVASVAQAGIIAGSNGRINPLAKATRAEIAVMLSRVLAK